MTPPRPLLRGKERPAVTCRMGGCVCSRTGVANNGREKSPILLGTEPRFLAGHPAR